MSALQSSVANIEVDAMRRELTRLETKEARFRDDLAERVLTAAAYKRGSDPLLAEIANLRQALASRRSLRLLFPARVVMSSLVLEP